MSPKPKTDLIGRKFGRLEILGIAPRDGKNTKLLCGCECGSEKAIRRDSILSGATVSCGCYFADTKSASTSLDITGLRSGRLVALRRVGTHAKSRCAEWQCQCDCGSLYVGFASRIKAGLVTSCGCANADHPRLGPQRWREMQLKHALIRRAREAGSIGSFTEGQVAELLVKQRGKCANCSAKLGDQNMSRDHRQAIARGGSNDILNIELLCKPCNNRKSAKDQISWANENGRLL